MVDTPALGAGSLWSGGSSPSKCTKFNIFNLLIMILTIQDVYDQLTHKLSEPFVNNDSKTLIESIRYYLQQYNKDSTIDLRTSPDWKQRMKGEYLSLKEKTEKLHKALIKWDAGTVVPQCNTPIEVLQTQYKHMTNYLNTLEVRMELEGIEY